MKKINYAIEVKSSYALNGEVIENTSISQVADVWSPEREEYIKGIAYNGEYTIETIEDVSMTAEEARAERDKLLAETDWTQVLDAPIDATTREAYRTYRQALRDIPEQEGFPETITWPELPSVTKADPDPVDTAVDTMLGGETA